MSKNEILFIFNENVQYNQIKCNTVTIESLKLSSYQYIKLFIIEEKQEQQQQSLILQVFPDPTIDNNIILLSNEIIKNFNNISNSNNNNRYSFKFEPIPTPIPTPTNNNNESISITIKKYKTTSSYNGKIINDTLKRYFLNKPIIKDCLYMLPMVGNMCIFKVIEIKDNNNKKLIGSYKSISGSFNNIEEIKILDNRGSDKNHDTLNNELIDVKEQAEQIIEFLNLKFKSSFTSTTSPLSFLNTKGILIDGPQGTNKLPLIEYISKQYRNSKYINLNNSEDLVVVKQDQQDQQGECKEKEPLIYLINDLDSMIGKITDNENNYQKKLIQRFSNFIDHMKPNEIILSTCTNIESIDQSITRAGRIDKFIHLSIPTQSKRILILKNILKNSPLNLNQQDETASTAATVVQPNTFKDRDEFILELSKITPGFLYKDLTKLCRTVSLLTISEQEEEEEEETTGIKFETFQKALLFIKPSTLINFDITIQNVKWEKIGGYKQVLERFRELIEWPIKYQETFKRLSLNNSSGLLLHGPSGCGKSLMVKAIATEMNINFISIKGSDIYSKWLGESERIIRELFKSARLSSPCIMFFDEIDSLTLSRGNGGDDSNEDGGTSKRILSQLLNEMDGIQIKSQIFLIGCTNSIHHMDSALLRPGRFETLIKIDLPSFDDRLDILKVISLDLNFNRDEIDNQVWLEIAIQTEGFTGSQLYNLCNQAGIIQLETDINSLHISKESLFKSLNKIKN